MDQSLSACTLHKQRRSHSTNNPSDRTCGALLMPLKVQSISRCSCFGPPNVWKWRERHVCSCYLMEQVNRQLDVNLVPFNHTSCHSHSPAGGFFIRLGLVKTDSHIKCIFFNLHCIPVFFSFLLHYFSSLLFQWHPSVPFCTTGQDIERAFNCQLW